MMMRGHGRLGCECIYIYKYSKLFVIYKRFDIHIYIIGIDFQAMWEVCVSDTRRGIISSMAIMCAMVVEDFLPLDVRFCGKLMLWKVGGLAFYANNKIVFSSDKHNLLMPTTP